ncbi:MAG TPA: DNA mismatch repair endonuclease MutL [Chthoniobacterales bacterium]|jgi:DNA mismatch repair protein MutL|nr:DNA mismatch repair endonuclease MutL [Chthoniobacterales bacterium]
MGRILLLPDDVASQVAAGEVVERPASVVKELVENSVDAGATRIEVAIARGGISLMRIVDNGIGMDRDDALLCLERHATSKIRTGGDLAKIRTLGFRGEALPSIASVSRFRLSTRSHEALEGTEVLVNGGKINLVKSSGEAPGTQIEVRSLFYNLPARRKFLRSENTEASHIQHQLILQAIGHPQVGFVFMREQNLVFQAPPAATLIDRIRDLRGGEFLEQLLEVPPDTANGITVYGCIGKAGISRATRTEQILFVNGRPVENITLQHGLREGYHTALMRGQFPVTFLFLEMDPEAVDVNVHPAKREVRFRGPDGVKEAVANAVRKTLEADRKRWSDAFQRPEKARVTPESGSRLPIVDTTPALIPPSEQFSLRRDWSEFNAEGTSHAPSVERPTVERSSLYSEPIEPTQGGSLAGCSAPVFSSARGDGDESDFQRTSPASSGSHSRSPFDFRILGVLGKLYILMENPDGLVLVDQHAAHERILFERLRKQMESAGVPIQRLLIPLTVSVTPKDYDWILTNAPTLEKMGFALEPFGDSTLKVDGIPPFFPTDDPGLAIRKLVDELRSITTSTSRLRMGEESIAKTVCRHAIKANDDLRLPEVENLIRDLLACDLPFCCPHGRPTMIQVGYGELEKKFGRKV